MSKTKAEKRKRVPNLEEMNSLMLDARATAASLTDRTARDAGTCVLGAGIVVLDPKTHKHTVLVHAPFQGNVGSYQALKPVLEALQRRYPQFLIEWYDGVMD